MVQLFNAVSKHQKSLEEKLKEAGPSERKKRKGNPLTDTFGVSLVYQSRMSREGARRKEFCPQKKKSQIIIVVQLLIPLLYQHKNSSHGE